MKYINDIISSGNVKDLKNSKGQMIKQVVENQGIYLQELIEKHLKEYREHFRPMRYWRTGSLEDSVCVSSVRYQNGVFTVYVYFNEKALHRSGFGAWSVKKGRGKYDDDIQDFDSNKSVNTAYLINYGYTVKKSVWFADKENFGYREGVYFVEAAIDEFNKTNSMGIYIPPSSIITKREWGD